MTDPVKASEVQSKAAVSQRRERRKTPAQIVRASLPDDPRLAERVMLREAGERQVERLRRIAEGEK